MSEDIEGKVRAFLLRVDRGEAELPNELIEEFGERCKDVLRAQVERSGNKDETRGVLRMSSLGRPKCQLQMEASGAEREEEDYSFPMKMLFGDVIEALALVFMKGAGVNINSHDVEVELDVEGEKIKGTYDVEIDGEIFDIKSTSPYSFQKFSKGFSAVSEDDPFGYLTQGFCYGSGSGKRFGGWIVINKVTGEWTVCRTPYDSGENRDSAIANATVNVRAIVNNEPFERCFEAVRETFNKKSTGRYILGTNCGYCAYKRQCWGDIEYKPNPSSKAQFPKSHWYIGDS